MPMKNPPHPGRSIKDACLDPLHLSVTEGAKVLGVARHTLSRVINGQAGISAEMAIRLEKAGWSNADHWLRLQTAFDLAQARRHESTIKVKRYEPEELSVR
jgi:antitoxin HigA-1